MTLNGPAPRIRHRGPPAADRRFGPRVRSLAFKVLSGAEDSRLRAVFEAGASWSTTTPCAATTGRRCSGPTRRSTPDQRHAGLRSGGPPVRAEHHAAGRENYTNYAGQIEKMIAYVRQCFPAAVLVLGVSDRSVKTDAGFEPMDAIPHMLDCQRGGAEHRRSLLATCDAMRAGRHGTVRRTAGPARTTHINYAGGRRVAWCCSTPSTPGLEVYTEAEASSAAGAGRLDGRGPPSTAVSPSPPLNPAQ
ncbi:MAG: hypothetical protein ACLRMJ_00160 [Alistipes finegoldii]